MIAVSKIAMKCAIRWLNTPILTCSLLYFLSSKDNNKGFDNLANNEQGEQQKKDEEENQEKPKTPEETTSCEHQDQRERLGKENQAEGTENQENQEKDGIIACFLLFDPDVFHQDLKVWGEQTSAICAIYNACTFTL